LWWGVCDFGWCFFENHFSCGQYDEIFPFLFVLVLPFLLRVAQAGPLPRASRQTGLHPQLLPPAALTDSQSANIANNFIHVDLIFIC
jgi:hypothetical protein